MTIQGLYNYIGLQWITSNHLEALVSGMFALST